MPPWSISPFSTVPDDYHSDPSRGYQDPAQDEIAFQKRMRDGLRNFSNGIIASQIKRTPTDLPRPPQIEVHETTFNPNPIRFSKQNQQDPSSKLLDTGGIIGNCQVVTSVNSSGNAIWGVLFGSTVSDNPSSATSGSSITGTLSQLNPTPSDSGFFVIQPSDAIWIKATVSGASATYSIETLAGSNFGGGWNEYTSDGMTPPTYTQSFSRLVLATATTSTGIIQTFNQLFLGSPRMFFSAQNAYLSGGGSPQGVNCYAFF